MLLSKEQKICQKAVRKSKISKLTVWLLSEPRVLYLPYQRFGGHHRDNRSLLWLFESLLHNNI